MFPALLVVDSLLIATGMALHVIGSPPLYKWLYQFGALLLIAGVWSMAGLLLGYYVI